VSADALRLHWVESGGPAVSPPTRRGFGSRLIERGLRHEIGGRVALLFAPSGLTCTIEAPLGRPAAGIAT
jgi:two-component sensor histidine kinase